MTKQRYEGRTAAEAAIRACEALGLTRSELKYAILSDEGELLSRRVVIEVDAPAPRPVAPPPAPAAAPSPRARKAATPDDDGQSDAASEGEARPRRRSRSPRSDRAERGERSARSDRDRSDRSEPSEDETAEAPAPRGERAAASEGRGGREGRPARAGRAAPAGHAAGDDSHEPAINRAPRAAAPVKLTDAGPRRGAPADDVSSVDAADRASEATGRDERRGGRSRRGGRQGSAEGREPRERNGREDRDSRDDRDASERAAPRGRSQAHDADGSRRDAPHRGRNGEPRAGRQPREGIDSLLAMQADDALAQAPLPKLPAIAPTSERSKNVLRIVADLVRLMGFDLEARLVSENEAEIHVHLHGPAEKRAVGDKGEVLLSLQFAVNRILSRHEDEGEQVLVLDAGGYRQRRQLAIEKLARDLAERALAHSKAVRLSPMSAHDRRIVHMALKDVEGIATQSEGDGVFRNLLILPSAFV